jgi:hypothetical protein
MEIERAKFTWAKHTPHWVRGPSPGQAVLELAACSKHPTNGNGAWLSLDTTESNLLGNGSSKRTIVTISERSQLLELRRLIDVALTEESSDG